MNVILVSSRLAKSRSITLGGWQVLFLLLLFSWLVWVAAFALQYTLVRFAPEDRKSVV